METGKLFFCFVIFVAVVIVRQGLFIFFPIITLLLNVQNSGYKMIADKICVDNNIQEKKITAGFIGISNDNCLWKSKTFDKCREKAPKINVARYQHEHNKKPGQQKTWFTLAAKM